MSSIIIVDFFEMCPVIFEEVLLIYECSWVSFISFSFFTANSFHVFFINEADNKNIRDIKCLYLLCLIYFSFILQFCNWSYRVLHFSFCRLLLALFL